MHTVATDKFSTTDCGPQGFGKLRSGAGWTRRAVFLVGALIGAAAMTAGTAAATDFAKSFPVNQAQAGQTVDHSIWDGLLKRFVKPGEDGLNRVDYAVWKADGRAQLTAYLHALEATDPGLLTRDEQFAYWANLYNAKTIDVVLEAYPVDSIKSIRLGGGLFATFKGGPWDAEVVTVKGEKLTLNNIEHDILRGLYGDPRVHYAVNCASVGCPNLGTEAFTGKMLDTQLEASAAAYVNSPRGVALDGNEVVVSSIYNWFDADFGGSEKGVIAHLSKYAKDDRGRALATAKGIDGYAYDWSLNDVAK